MNFGKNVNVILVLTALTLLCPSVSWASLPVLFFDDFDDGNYNGWSPVHPVSGDPTTPPDIVPSPQGFSLRGVGSGYSHDPGLNVFLSHPLLLSNVVELCIEMRAKSGPQWPNLAEVSLVSGSDYYFGKDYGESNRKADFYSVIGGQEDVYSYDIGDRAYEWHDFAWTRDADGWWSLSIDGIVEASNFYQNKELTSFNKVAIHILRNQSEIEWVRISGNEISIPGVSKVSTKPATHVGSTSATLNARIEDDGGEACQCRFDYWSKDTYYYGWWSGHLTTGESYNEMIHGLKPGTLYHFQSHAKNSTGENDGNMLSFITLPECEGTVLLLDPNGGEELVAGSTYEITWETTDTIENILIEYSTDNGTDWTVIDTVSNTGLYEWLVPQENSQQCLVRISGEACSDINDTSDDVFTIYECTLAFDLNHDCVVDDLDLDLLMSEFGMCGNPFDPNCLP